MKVFILIGRKKTGKTTFCVQLIKTLQRPKNYIFDVVNEYEKKYKIENAYTGPLDHDLFLNAASKAKNSLIVLEEAASYLSNRGREQILLKMMQESRHTNNAIIIIYIVYKTCRPMFTIGPTLSVYSKHKTFLVRWIENLNITDNLWKTIHR